MDDLVPMTPYKRYIHHYNFPPYSVGEARAPRSPGRREIGHGALAERALLPVLPDQVEEFPYTMRLRLRGSVLQWLHLPGFHLRLYAGPDGRRCAHQGTRCRYLLRPYHRW